MVIDFEDERSRGRIEITIADGQETVQGSYIYPGHPPDANFVLSRLDMQERILLFGTWHDLSVPRPIKDGIWLFELAPTPTE
jgi:hypothetical protein